MPKLTFGFGYLRIRNFVPFTAPGSFSDFDNLEPAVDFNEFGTWVILHCLRDMNLTGANAAALPIELPKRKYGYC